MKRMSVEKRVAMEFINNAEKVIGGMPREVRREAVRNIVRQLKKAKKGETVDIQMSCYITRMGYGESIECLY